MNINIIRLIKPGIVAIDTTVLKNRILLAIPASRPSCSASIETVAAVGKAIPRDTIHFMTGAIGIKYRAAAVSSGSTASLTALPSIVTRSFIMSLNLYPESVEPMNIIAIGVEIFPIYKRYSSTASGIPNPRRLTAKPIIKARIFGFMISLNTALTN